MADSTSRRISGLVMWSRLVRLSMDGFSQFRSHGGSGVKSIFADGMEGGL